MSTEFIEFVEVLECVDILLELVPSTFKKLLTVPTITLTWISCKETREMSAKSNFTNIV